MIGCPDCEKIASGDCGKHPNISNVRVVESTKPKKEVLQRCENCWHFMELPPEHNDYDGECKRWPPQIMVRVSGSFVTAFPEVYRDSWCGEFLPFDSKANFVIPATRRRDE